MFESPWHVLHVAANHEKRVAQHLTVRSLEHYLPLYTVRSKWTDRVVNLERPLFAGYVFVRYSPQARLAVVSTPGVLRLLLSGRAKQTARLRWLGRGGSAEQAAGLLGLGCGGGPEETACLLL